MEKELNLEVRFANKVIGFETLCFQVDENGLLTEPFDYSIERIYNTEQVIEEHKIEQYYVYCILEKGEKLPEYLDCQAQLSIDGLEEDLISVDYMDHDEFIFSYAGNDFSTLQEAIYYGMESEA